MLYVTFEDQKLLGASGSIELGYYFTKGEAPSQWSPGYPDEYELVSLRFLGKNVSELLELPEVVKHLTQLIKEEFDEGTVI